MTSSPDQPADPILAQASRWVIRLHAADCTAAERQAFAVWLAQSERHRTMYRDVESLWQRLGGLGSTADPQLQAARAYLQQARRKRRRLTMPRLALVASLLLAVTTAPYWWPWLAGETYRTAIGEHRHITLSDGSSIDLNTDSVVRVYDVWNARRATLERGEALFSIVHDGSNLFAVAADEGRIRDLGTQFDVYRQDNGVTVTVLEGEVAVSTDQGSVGSVRAGYRVGYDHEGRLSATARTDIADAAAWREGRLVFKGQSLAEVLRQLGRYHDTGLTLRDPQLAALSVSGSFPTDNLNLALDTLAAALPVKITRTGQRQILLEPR
ncbi:MAG: FecR domain-containing protein [Methylovulum sp.]|nr:FecR domain-containing protein [Methylovulum sp.]